MRKGGQLMPAFTTSGATQQIEFTLLSLAARRIILSS